jgi:hypothetical protein
MIITTPNAHQLKPPNPYPTDTPQHPHQHNPDTITLGCSITYGSFLPDTYAWPYLAALATGTIINNLGAPGEPLSTQIHKLTQHTPEYGTPKNVWILAPEQHRSSIHVWNKDEQTKFQSINWDTRYLTYTHRNKPYKHSPSPGTPKPLHKNHDIHPEHQIVRTLELLTILQWWAQTTHTKLLVTSWDEYTRQTLTQTHPDIIHNPQHTTKAPLTKWSDANLTFFHPAECDHQPQNKHQQKRWTIADDERHPGLHTQIHIAEHYTNTTITNQHLQQIG